MEQKTPVISQDERWDRRYRELLAFYVKHHRRPSKHYDDEKLRHHWLHHQKKLFNTGKLNPDRIERFKHLLEIDQMYRHKNQWV